MMDDLKLLKERHDLRLIVEADLGPAHCRGGKALLWRCPFHNEHKGYSLAVWENGWRCFGACGTQGDVLDWLQRYRGLSFTEACEYLGTAPKSEQTRPVHRQARTTAPFAREAEPPKAEWQAEAKAVVDGAESVLWSPESGRALQYLKQRGLTEETILRARLGYLPGRPWEWLRLGKLTIPCGITIPWFVGQELWAVKVRRAAGLPKYTQIAGGSAQGLYNAANLEGHETVLFVEGEFDALLAEQECGGLVGVATVGSAAATLNAHWLPLLLHCKTILVAYDADEAGMKGAARLQALTKRARVIQVPWGKDITEFVLKGGSVQQWLNEVL
jgi:DNA primase